MWNIAALVCIAGTCWTGGISFGLPGTAGTINI